ncbi:MAG: cohesin domain-containing protein [Candidatus Cloacimonetes bacterium]|nr:cohesin domain-containing protein [Candidatus Cloacimonadota bacterium]
MIRRSTFLSMLLIAICLVGWQSLSAALEIYMDQSQYHIRNHDVIRVDVKIKGAATEIRGYQIEFDYDSEHLEIVDGSAFEEGGFLYENGRTQFYAIGKPGHYQVACSILGLTWGSMGSGTLFSVHLKAIKSTDANGTDLIMPNIILRDPLNNAIPVDEINGSNVIIDALLMHCKIKAYLQGAYLTNGSMRHSLISFLPLTSPYDENDIIDILPDVSPNHIVDWVSVQLRETYNGPILVSQSAFLLDNGMVVDMDGNSYLSFEHTDLLSYYVILRHRNHLGVMSAVAHEFSLDYEDAPLIDFSQAETLYGGAVNAAMQVDSNIFALIAGDANGDGRIANNDQAVFWRSQNGSFGYHSADFDLNGAVQNSDMVIYWRNNNGRVSVIP